jgi:hypothetical protein
MERAIMPLTTSVSADHHLTQNHRQTRLAGRAEGSDAEIDRGSVRSPFVVNRRRGGSADPFARSYRNAGITSSANRRIERSTMDCFKSLDSGQQALVFTDSAGQPGSFDEVVTL